MPKGDTIEHGAGTNVEANNDAIVEQYFFRDPDGYYLEVCSCHVLDDHCLAKREDLPGHHEAIQPITVENALRLSLIGLRMAKLADASWSRVQRFMDVGYKCKPHAEIAKTLGCISVLKS